LHHDEDNGDAGTPIWCALVALHRSGLVTSTGILLDLIGTDECLVGYLRTGAFFTGLPSELQQCCFVCSRLLHRYRTYLDQDSLSWCMGLLRIFGMSLLFMRFALWHSSCNVKAEAQGNESDACAIG
jgi:hypothetical protein